MAKDVDVDSKYFPKRLRPSGISSLFPTWGGFLQGLFIFLPDFFVGAEYLSPVFRFSDFFHIAEEVHGVETAESGAEVGGKLRVQFPYVPLADAGVVFPVFRFLYSSHKLLFFSPRGLDSICRRGPDLPILSFLYSHPAAGSLWGYLCSPGGSARRNRAFFL